MSRADRPRSRPPRRGVLGAALLLAAAGAAAEVAPQDFPVNPAGARCRCNEVHEVCHKGDRHFLPLCHDLLRCDGVKGDPLGHCEMRDIWHTPADAVRGFIAAGLGAFAISALAVLAGVGGGGMLVPLYINAIGASARLAVPMSQATILGSSLLNVAVNIGRRHPNGERPVIEYAAAGVLMPMTLAGTTLGKVLGNVLPGWLKLFLLCILLGYTLKKTVARARGQRAKELLEESQAANEAARPAPHHSRAEESPERQARAGGSNTPPAHGGYVRQVDDSDVDGTPLCAANKGGNGDREGSPRQQDSVPTPLNPLAPTSATARAPATGAGQEPAAAQRTQGPPHPAPRPLAAPGPLRRPSAAGGARGHMDVGNRPPQRGGGPPAGASESDATPTHASPPDDAQKGRSNSFSDYHSPQNSFIIAPSTPEIPGGDFSLGFEVKPPEPVSPAVIEQLSAHGGDSCTERLQCDYDATSPRQYPPFWLGMLLGGWVLLGLLSYAQQEAPCGSAAFWGCVAAVVGSMVALAAVASVRLRGNFAHKVAAGYHFGEEDIRWDLPRNTLYFPLAAIAAGIGASLLGIGGGMVLGPMLYEMGLGPQAQSATSGVATFFVASGTVIQFALAGEISAGYPIVACMIGFVAAVFGHFVIGYYIRRSNRTSLIIWSMVFIIAGSMVALSVTGALQVYDNMQMGASVGFRDMCPGTHHHAAAPAELAAAPAEHAPL